MRFFVERGVRCSFYVIIGLSMVLVTTPDLSGAFHFSGALFLWPVIGLLTYFLHLFEDTGKLASVLRTGLPGGRRYLASAPGISRMISGGSTAARAKRA